MMTTTIELTHKTDNVNSASTFSVQGRVYLLCARRFIPNVGFVYVGIRDSRARVFLASELDCLGVSLREDVYYRYNGCRYRAKVLEIDFTPSLFSTCSPDSSVTPREDCFKIKITDPSFSSPVCVLWVSRERLITLEEMAYYDSLD